MHALRVAKQDRQCSLLWDNSPAMWDNCGISVGKPLLFEDIIGCALLTDFQK